MRRSVLAVLIAGILFFPAQMAMALTAANTDITNKATLVFGVSGVSSTLESSPTGNSTLGVGLGTNTTFKVDKKVDLTMANVSAVPLTATGTDNIMIFSITNDGNASQTYQLRLYAGNVAPDDFEMESVVVCVDADKNGACDAPGTTWIYATNGSVLGVTPTVVGDVTGTPAGDNTIQILVTANVPAAQPTGDDAYYTLKAETFETDGLTATDNFVSNVDAAIRLTSLDTVLADAAATDTAVGGATDAANDGDFFKTNYFRVSNALISISKTVSVLWDPINSATDPAAIPGAYVQYVMTISNAAGGASATLTTLSDTLSGNLAFDPDLMTSLMAAESVAGSGFKVVARAATTYKTTTAGDTDGLSHSGTATGGTIAANFVQLLPTTGTHTAGELKAGESVVITFNAIIQ